MKLRSAELDTPTLVDRMTAELLDHLIACRTCSAVFAAQRHSLGETECVEGKRIVSEPTINQQNRRANLAIRHLTEEILDDYILDRLASDERQTLEQHLDGCSQCAKAAEERESLASWIRAAFDHREHGVNTSSIPGALLSVEDYASVLSACG